MSTKIKNIKSIIDIAKLANVSKSTVSRALNNNPRIKKETKDKILSIIDKYKFSPNQLARSLRTTFTNSIGVIVGDINNPFYFDMIRGIEIAANNNNFNILLVSAEYNYLKELTNLKTLISKKVDGILACTTLYNPSIIPLFKEIKIPFVFVDTQPFDENLSFVYTDQLQSGVIATNYLINRGHTRILIIYGPKRKYENYFIKGYKASLRVAKIKFDKDLVIECPLYLKNVYRVAFEFFKSNKKNITAVITSDHVSQAIYKAVDVCGLKIPDDISIVGNDDIPVVKYFIPPLTTISQPKYKMGEIATNILLDKIESKYSKNHIIELKPKIIERESVSHV